MLDLDARQRAAVDAGPEDLFISAGAGSGKTRVLTARFAHAVLGVSPYEPSDLRDILTITFTEKAAGSLTNRIRQALDRAGRPVEARQVSEAWISTIHGMCTRVLRHHAFDAGIDPRFTVLDEVEAGSLEVRAFEEAVGPLLRDRDDVERLFDDAGFAEVVAAARAIRADVRAMGLGVDSIRVADLAETEHSLRAVADELSSLGVEAAGLDGGKTAAANAAALTTAATAIKSALDEGLLDAAPALRETLECVRVTRAARIEGMNDLVERGKALIDDANADVAQALAGGMETAFLDVLEAFDGAYAAAKQERGSLDFEDLQWHTAMLFERHPAVAERYRRRFAMVMIDEFQDTDELQLRIINQMARENLCTVGDENQSIYGFRHADIEIFRRRSAAVSLHRELDVNYRTAPDLLAGINGLFGSPALFGERFMRLSPPESADAERAHDPWPSGAPRMEVSLIDWSDPHGGDRAEAEAECIASRVRELVDAGAEPGDIAVLLRMLRGGRAEAVERALRRRGIPALLGSGGTFFESPEVCEVRALLQLLVNLSDDQALATVLFGRMAGLSDDALLQVTRRAEELRAESTPGSRPRLWDAATDAQLVVPAADRAILDRLAAAVRAARRARGFKPLGDVIMAPLLDLDYDLALFASGPGGRRAWANVCKLARMAEDFERAAGGDLGAFIDYLALREVHAPSEQEAVLAGAGDAVRIMSIHSAKGLEFPIVVVAGISTKRPFHPQIACARIGGGPLLGVRLSLGDSRVDTSSFRSIRGEQAARAEEEEKRLLYVACTRAERGLVLVVTTALDKDAPACPGGVVRDALGFAGAGSAHAGMIPVGDGHALVRIVDPPAEAPRREPAAIPACEVLPPLPAIESAPQPDAAVRPARVSYSGLSLYQRCPYRYYLQTVARLRPREVAGTGKTDPRVFGGAVHAALERCHSRVGLSPEEVARVAAAHGLSPQESSRLSDALAGFLGSQTAATAFSCERVQREAPIAVSVAGTVLVGAIDLIAWDGDSALVVDYKTGAAPLAVGDATERYRLQGACYALAALAAGAARVRVVFSEVERGREVDFEYSGSERITIEGEIASIVEGMATGAYAPRDAYEETVCRECPGLGSVCPVTPPRGGAAG